MNDIKGQDNIDEMFKSLRDSEPYLPGADFTAAVMAELPQPVELPVWKKNLLIFVATIIGTALAASLMPVGAVPVTELVAQLITSLMNLKVLGSAGIAVFCLSGGVIWATNNRDI